MLRTYKVNFAHKRYGRNYDSETVVVSGYALQAIKKALSLRNGDRDRVLVEAVELIAVGE